MFVLKSTYRTLQLVLAECEAQVERLADELIEAEELIDTLGDQVDDLEERVAELQDENERLEHALDDTDPALFLAPFEEDDEDWTGPLDDEDDDV